MLYIHRYLLIEFMLIFFRILAMIMILPFIGSTAVPNKIKVGTAFFIAVIMYPMVVKIQIIPHISLAAVILLIFSQILIGLILGFLVLIIFSGVELAGQFAGFQIGYGMISLINPLINNAEVSLLANMWNFIALMLFLISRDTVRKKAEIAQKSVEEKKIVPESQVLESVMQVDIIELEVGYGLISYVDSSRSGELLERIKGLRKQIAADIGMIVPPIHIKDNLALKPNEYVILIKGIEVSRFEIMQGKYLAMNPGNATANIAGTVTKEPAFNLPALWIDESDKQKAQLAGWTVVEIPAVIATHIVEIIKQNAAELLTRQDTQKLLNILSAKYPKIVDDLIPNVLSLSTVQKILENLLNEGVPIKDMLTIIETLLDYGTTIKDPLLLTEYVRSALKRTITKTILDADGSVKVITLGKNFESAMLNEYKKAKELGVYSAIEQPVYQKIIGAVKEQVKKALDGGHTPIILTSPAIRLFVKNILKDIIPGVVVVSSAEIAPNIKLQSIGNMEIDYAN